MSRFRTCVVGREPGCDVRLDNHSISRRHAEVVRLSSGRLYVTDCSTTNGTFILDGDAWRTVRQTFLEPTGRIRFGDHEMSAGRLDALCLQHETRSSRDHDADAPPDTPDRLMRRDLETPDRLMRRDLETGELPEQAPRANARRQ